MRMHQLFSTLAIAVFSTVCFSASASAFCGTVSASANGDTKQEAISAANNIGLKKTNQLDSKYGSSVKYQQAKVNCQESHVLFVCNITQKYCVNEPAKGEEGSAGNTGCPKGTRPVPETDNCVSIDENNVNSPKCKKWKRKCDNGSTSSCTKYETNCQND